MRTSSSENRYAASGAADLLQQAVCSSRLAPCRAPDCATHRSDETQGEPVPLLPTPRADDTSRPCLACHSRTNPRQAREQPSTCSQPPQSKTLVTASQKSAAKRAGFLRDTGTNCTLLIRGETCCAKDAVATKGCRDKAGAFSFARTRRYPHATRGLSFFVAA